MMDDEGDPPSSEKPVYSAVRTSMDVWMVICDEGWRQSIVCTGMYPWAAAWLVTVLDRRPYATTARPGGTP